MNKQEIHNHLSEVFDNWLKSIENEELRFWCKCNAYIAGGCFASLMLDQEVNDYDIFFKTGSDFNKLFDYYMLKAITTDNAINPIDSKIQLITRLDTVGKPITCTRQFDFMHCTCYYDPLIDEVIIPSEAEKSIRSRTLCIKPEGIKDNNIMNTLYRTLKLCKRGWTIESPTFRSLILRIANFSNCDTNSLLSTLGY